MDLTRQSIALPATRSRPCIGKVGHVRLASSHTVGKSTPILGSQPSPHPCVDLEQDHPDESPLQVLVQARSTHDEMLFNGQVLGGCAYEGAD